MTTIRKLFAVAALATAMPAAFAASTVDLTVSGTIVPASCTPTLGSTNVHFGKHSVSDLKGDEHTWLGRTEIESTLTVNCAAATLYALRGIDNRSGSVDHNGYEGPFGLGMTANGEKLGAHYVTLFPALSTIDGKAAFATLGNVAGTTWSGSSSAFTALRNNGNLVGFTDVAGLTTGPIPIQDAVLTIHHVAFIAPTAGLTLTDEVTLDGSTTIEVVYL